MNRACFIQNANLHEQNQHAVPKALGIIRPLKNNFPAVVGRMKISPLLILASIVIILIVSCKRSTITGKPELKNDIDSISYFSGIFTAYSIRSFDDTTLNTKIFCQAVNEVLKEKDFNIGKAETDYNIGRYFNELRKKGADRNLKIGKEFLSKNRIRNGVITTPSGLQYEVIREGNGVKPKTNEKVIVTLKVSFFNGKEFISTLAQGPPDTLLVSKTMMLPGVLEALQLMKVGSSFKLYLPSGLAFGDNPPPINGLKPNMVVVYEVELHSIVGQKSKK